MSIEVYVDDEFVEYVNDEALRLAAKATIEAYRPETEHSLTITITDDESIEQLNELYRGIPEPTDVLSFENQPDEEFPQDEEGVKKYLGDIIIAYPIAEDQAYAGGHSVPAELVLLTVHGTLHLMGFDHDSAERKNEMWTAQQQIMTMLGLPDIQPTES